MKDRDIVNAILAIVIGGSQVSQKIATEISTNITPTMIDTLKQLSRRDFLKLAGSVAGGLPLAPLITPEGADGNFPTRISPTPQETLDSFKKAALSGGVDQKLVDQATAFTITVGFSNWDFLILPPSISTNTNSDGTQTETNERIFIKEPIFSLHGVQYVDRKRNLFRSRFVELQIDPTRTMGADGKTPIVTWSMIRQEPRPDKDQEDQILDPIIWYPKKTEEEWAKITKDKVLSEYLGYIGFAPPPSAGLFTNWIIERDITNAYPVDLSGELPEPSRRALIRRERVEISPEPALPAEMEELQKNLNDNYEVTNEGIIDKSTGKLLSDVRFDLSDPQKPTWSRVYQYMDFTGEGIKDNEGNPVQLDGIVVLPQPMEKITADENGNPIFDFPGHTWNPETKEFGRKVFEGEPVLSKDEAQLQIIKDGDLSLQVFSGDFFKFNGDKGKPGRYNDLEEFVTRKGFHASIIPVKDVNGDFKLVKTTQFFVSNFRNVPLSYIVYRNNKKEWKMIVMDIEVYGVWSETALDQWSEYFVTNPPVWK